MSTIEANVTINIPDEVDYSEIINILNREITNITGNQTKINVIEIDDPLSLSPIALRNLKE
jgi:hypothetical protein